MDGTAHMVRRVELAKIVSYILDCHFSLASMLENLYGDVVIPPLPAKPASQICFRD